jgi:hypothetical protein
VKLEPNWDMTRVCPHVSLLYRSMDCDEHSSDRFTLRGIESERLLPGVSLLQASLSLSLIVFNR